jgi:tetratricopeptide (TPR) repeat protein
VKIVYRSTFADQRPFDREFDGIKKFEAISHSHPSQLSLFQVGRNAEDGYFYYVMELADPVVDTGAYQPRTLRTDLSNGRIPAAQVLEIGLALTEALAHLHANGLIHRDVKPSNIIFVNGRPKLADIGLVTDASDSRSIVGTEGYLPNEGPGTPAADIFALGKVLYEALTGLDRRQFPTLPAPLREWSDKYLIFEINEIVLKACAVHSIDRYQTAGALLADLKRLGAGKSIQRRRSLQRAGTLAAKLAAVAAIVFLIGWFSQPKQRSADAFENSGTTNFAAFQANQLAISMVTTYTVQSMSNSVRELERAVALDPHYGRAWTLLALVISLQIDYGYVNGKDALPRAKHCVEQGFKFSRPPEFGTIPEIPYGTLAEINLALDYDFPRAEQLFRKSFLTSRPRSDYHHNFARILLYYGRFDEAEKILRRIVDAEPDRGGSFIVLAQVYGATGRYQEAFAAYETAAATSNRPYLYFNRADLHAGLNDRAAAARDLLRFIELHGFASLDPLNEGATLRLTLNQRGPEAFLRDHIELLETRRAGGQFVSAYDLARLHQHAGNSSRALDYLELAVDEHRHMALAVKVNPLFKPLHGDPRFHAVLRRFRLE